jgi:hypothetical protein
MRSVSARSVATTLSFATVLLAVGCSAPTEAGTPIAELKNKVVYLNLLPRVDLGAELGSDDCSVLRSDAVATLDGQPIDLDRGRHDADPPPGTGPCYYPLARADLTSETATTLDLEISDSSATVSVRIINYHPFPFEVSGPPTSTVRSGDSVVLAVGQEPEMPDKVDVSFYPAPNSSGVAAWTTDGALMPGSVQFTVPSDAPVGAGSLGLCGWFPAETQVGACLEATCMLDKVLNVDCRSFAVSVE